jgi:hypothetical protein
MTVKEEARKLTPRQREGRAINAVAELLRRNLSVPNIYLEPPSALTSADVLAVDRGGAGDLHAVEIKLEGGLRFSKTHHGLHRQLMSMPAHFRYLAIPAERYDRDFGELGHLGLFPEDGIGRLGVIAIREKGDAPPTAEMVITPERFRVDPMKLKTIETRLLAKSRPDIEVRI